jgi:hypothetical protein
MINSNDFNCIKRRVPLTGIHKTSTALTISLIKAKAIAKNKGITFNDLVMGLISQSMKSYFKKYNDETKTITVALPFSFS